MTPLKCGIYPNTTPFCPLFTIVYFSTFLQLFGNYYTNFIKILFPKFARNDVKIARNDFTMCLYNSIMNTEKRKTQTKQRGTKMKQMRNKKARQIAIDYFGSMAKERRTLHDCYTNPSPHKESAWETVYRVAVENHRASRVQIYGYNTFTFTVVYYGEVDGVRGIVYVTPENRWLIPESFIEKVLRE